MTLRNYKTVKIKIKKTYFMNHNNCYYYDSITNALQLTENAPKKAIESYNMLFSNKDDILREDFMPCYMPVINEASLLKK